MMKQTEFFEESWQRKKPREKLKKLDSSKKLNLRKSRSDFKNWPWRLQEMQQESKRNKRKLRSKKDSDRSNLPRMKLREESVNKMKKMSGKD